MRLFSKGSCFFNTLAFILISVFQPQSAQAENILVVIMFGSQSHKAAFDPLFEELAARGHQITIVSLYKPSKANANITQIEAFDYDEVWNTMQSPFELRLQGKSLVAFYMLEMSEKICRSFYENPEVKKILKMKFDLILMNMFMSDCAYGFIHHFQSKFIFLSSMPVPTWISNSFGAPTIPALNSVFFYGFSERMTFYQRLVNFFGHIYYYYIRNYSYTPTMEAVYRDYFPDAPSALEIEKRANLILINSHPSMNPSMLLLPDMVEVGGMHCRNARPLPSDLKEFLDGSGDEGFIYFSMGSILKGTGMPKEYRDAFISAFSKLKQRVLWKYEDDILPNRPENVMIGKWLPQQDVLGHPNIRLFITHGGLLSAQEAIYHAVPLLGIPLFADQDGNMEQAQNLGYALKIELTEITEELILEKIRAILNDTRFAQRAKAVSSLFRDRPEAPIKTAVFWTEYIMRHQDGAQHLRSAGRELNFITFNSLDIIFTICFALFSSIYLLQKLIRIFYQKFQAGKTVSANRSRFLNKKNKSKLG